MAVTCVCIFGENVRIPTPIRILFIVNRHAIFFSPLSVLIGNTHFVSFQQFQSNFQLLNVRFCICICVPIAIILNIQPLTKKRWNSISNYAIFFLKKFQRFFKMYTHSRQLVVQQFICYEFKKKKMSIERSHSDILIDVTYSSFTFCKCMWFIH